MTFPLSAFVWLIFVGWLADLVTALLIACFYVGDARMPYLIMNVDQISSVPPLALTGAGEGELVSSPFPPCLHSRPTNFPCSSLPSLIFGRHNNRRVARHLREGEEERGGAPSGE